MVLGRGFRGVKEEVSGEGFRRGFWRRYLGSIQWEVSGGDFKWRFQEISGDSFSFSESLQVEVLGDGFMRTF